MQEKFIILLIWGCVIKGEIIMMHGVFNSDTATSHLFISKNLFIQHKLLSELQCSQNRHQISFLCGLCISYS